MCPHTIRSRWPRSSRYWESRDWQRAISRREKPRVSNRPRRCAMNNPRPPMEGLTVTLALKRQRRKKERTMRDRERKLRELQNEATDVVEKNGPASASPIASVPSVQCAPTPGPAPNRPKAHVMSAYRASHAKYASVYKKFAE